MTRYGEKKQSVKYAPVNHDWRPGFWKRFPWAGLTALLGAIAGTSAAGTTIIVASDGVEIARWRFQPATYLSLFIALQTFLSRSRCTME
jgi:hypothetical protein